MAFLRIRGGSISLVHGVRSADHGVRHKRLLTFPGGLAELRSWMEPKKWARLQLEVEQKHPDLAIDWAKLHEEATGLANRSDDPAAAPDFDETIRTLTRTSRKLRQHLARVKADDEGLKLLRCAGPELAQLGRLIVERYQTLRQPEERDYRLFLNLLLPDPEETASYVERGLYLSERGKMAQARQAFDRARWLDPCDPDNDISEGICWMENGRDDEAAVLFLRARELAWHQLPNKQRSYAWSQLEVRPYIRATYNLGLVRQNEGRLQEALDLYQECLRCCPQDGIGARLHLGPIHQRMGNLHLALDHHAQHCRGNLMDLPDAFYDMTSVLVQLNRPSEALERLVEGIAINRHIPLMLLKPPRRRGSSSDHAGVDSKDWARSYVQTNADLWPEQALEFLRTVWNDRILQDYLRRLARLDDELEKADPDGRMDVIIRKSATVRHMTSPEWVREFQQRLVAEP